MSSVYEALQRARQAGHGAVPLRQHPVRQPPREPLRSDITLSPGPLGAALAPLLAAVRPLVGGERGAVLHLVAASPGEGVSTIAREFALLASTTGNCRTALIDADRKTRDSARAFGADTGNGLVDALWDAPGDAEVLQPVQGALLSVACLVGEGGAGRFDGGTMREVYARLRARFDLVLVDCPAVGTGDYLGLAPEAADGVILVVQAETTRPAVVAHAKAQVEQAGGNLLGAVLNRRNNYIPEFLYRML